MSFRSPAARCHRDISNFLAVREATCADDSQVAELLLHSFDSTYSRKLPEAVLSEDRRRDLECVSDRRRDGGVWVLELGNKIVGTFSLLKPGSVLCESWLPQTAALRCLAVDPAFHGLGLSERLLSEAGEIIQLWGLKGICLHVIAGAIGVGRLYARHGYLRDRRGDKEFLGVDLHGYVRPLCAEIIQAKA